MQIQDRGIVYENPKPHLRTRHAFHPSLVPLGGPNWLCAYDVGEAIESLDYRTYRSRSADGGRTWTPEGPLITRPTARPSTSSVRISRVTGGLVGFGSRAYRDNPEEGILNRANLGYAPMDLILVRSADDGHTWTAPEIIQPPLAGPAFETCHIIVELPGGRWLAPTSTWRGWNGELPNGEKTIVLISEDQGKSWPAYGTIFDGTAEGLTHWEVSVIHLGGDNVLAVAWVYHAASGKHRPNRFALSRNGGKTFGTPGEIGINAQTCKGLRLKDGRILLVYRRTDKSGLWATLASFDGATRWNLMESIPLWGGGIGSSGMTGERCGSDELSALKFGFPQARQMDDGTVLMVFWCFEDWCTKIRWFRLEV